MSFQAPAGTRHMALLIYALLIFSVHSSHILGSHHLSPSHHKLHKLHGRSETPSDVEATVLSHSINESSTIPLQNNSVNQWIAANPELAAQVSPDKIALLRQRVHTGKTSNINRRAELQPRTNSTFTGQRHNVTSSQLMAARNIVKAAQKEVGEQNAHIRANPRLNSYIRQNKTSSTLSRRSEQVSVNATIAKAAAVVAEADATAKAGNGTLYRTYTLPDGFKGPNGHGGSSNIRERDNTFWMETVGADYPGTVPLDGDYPDYVVWRNVKDYGAVGDGVTDDTYAINQAIADGDRCGNGCGTTSLKMATVYFPPGTYLVSSPLIAYYNTQLIGAWNDLPVIKAAASFTGLGVITSDVYLASGEWYVDTDNFFRAVRNFVVDITDVTVDSPACVHWQVAQATSLENMYFYMNTDAEQDQVGVFAENGSGGFMADLNFFEGSIGLQCGNQQFTSRSMNFISCTTAISLLWDWGWTFKSLTITGAQYGVSIEGDTVGGSIYLIDSYIEDTDVGIAMPSSTSDMTTNYVNVENLYLSGVTTPVTRNGVEAVALTDEGNSYSFLFGRMYDPEYPDGLLGSAMFDNATAHPYPLSEALAGGPHGGYFERSRPQYGDLGADDFLNAKDYASGDGSADDTNALNMVFSVAASEGLAIYMPAGTYIVTDTVQIPSGTILVGECWSQIMASGDNFKDMTSPHVMVRVGAEGGEMGTVEIQDVLFTVRGATAGAVLVEWNMHASSAGAAAMWDSHFRVGGAVGTSLQKADCPTGSVNEDCISSSLMLHLTSTSSAYLENLWAWTADHDMDDVDVTQINVFSARGILIESQGPSWLYGTASEHSVLYQYLLSGAQDIFLGMIQTESPYYQPSPPAPEPFTSAVGIFDSDPDIPGDCDVTAADQADLCMHSWAVIVEDSTNIAVGGAGLYSWFVNYDEDCVNTQDCQLRLVLTDNNVDLFFSNLYTIGSIEMVVPRDSSVDISTAANNTNQVAYPWLAVISSWTDESGSDTGELTCGWNDTRAVCLEDPTTLCDEDLSFDSLDDLQAAADGIFSYCLDVYALPLLSSMLNDTLSSYDSVDDGYDSDFKAYQKYVKELIPVNLDSFMSDEDGPGNQYFTCTWEVDGVNKTSQTCPFDEYSLGDQYWTIYYTLENSTGFYSALLNDYGIESDWVQFGEDVDQNTMGLGDTHYKHVRYGFPLAADSITVPNPKDIVTKALPSIQTLQQTIDARWLDITTFQWSGANNDIVQVTSVPVFLLAQAVDSMSQVKSVGEEVKEEEKKEFILDIVSAVLFFVPFLGEIADVADGLAGLVRILDLIGEAGNAAVSVAGIIDDPSSALMDIMGFMLGGSKDDLTDADEYATRASARRNMAEDTIKDLGSTFLTWDEKLKNIVGSCSA